MKTLKITIVVTILCAFAVSSFAATVMIVNEKNSTSSLTRSDAANIFLGRKAQWSGGAKIAAVDQKKGTPVGDAFLSNIVKMKEADFKKVWVENMLSGSAEPMLVKGSDQEVIDFVKSNPGGIGYVDAKNVGAGVGVKVVPVDGKKEW